MSISAVTLDPSVMDIRFDADSVYFDLADARTISAPLIWFPRLHAAKAEQRGRWERIGRGYGIHWPDIDEDISVLNLLGLPD